MLAHLVDAGIGVSEVLKKYIGAVLGIEKAYSVPTLSLTPTVSPALTGMTAVISF